MASLHGKTHNSSETHSYDRYGAFTGVDSWKIEKTNARGQYLNIKLGENDQQDNGYDQYGYLRLRNINSLSRGSNYIHQRYNYDPTRGNLIERTQTANNLGNPWKKFHERFSYDNQDRLLITKRGQTVIQSNRYDASGRRTSGSDIGDFTYQSGSKKIPIRILNTK